MICSKNPTTPWGAIQVEIVQTKETNTSQNQLAKVYENSKEEVRQLAGMCLTVSISSQGKMTEGCVDSPSIPCVPLN